ncbi:hypothetical protein ATANTOWER_007614 [Ataeniobius toweri]|uniref:Uncharacterized protein n=1 Tax=Ataeniobius toweri TaxID=208326 RepID=A0ABU7BAQ6_9TELE|nr:hypothetical protein [Ataeniobius toweri]
MSSILCRPDCRKTGISPDVGALRKLVRDPKCRPVLRGIFESLLHYLMQDLLKRTTNNTSMEMAESSTVTQIHTRNTEEPGLQRAKKTLCQKGLKVVHPLQKKTGESSSNISEKCKIDQSTEELRSRRLTRFQLLQSKFSRSSPKPYNTNQKEVGTLASSRGVPGQDNRNHNRKHNTDTRDKGLKRRGSVKEIMAKFAMAEQKQQEMKTMKKEPLKPRHIGKGILLNSLMTRFENIATVCKQSDLSLSHEWPGVGNRVASKIKEKVAGAEREKQQMARQAFNKQNLGKSKTCITGVQKLKGIQITHGQLQNPEHDADILTKANSHTEDETHLKADSLDQEICCSLKRIKAQGHDIDDKVGGSKHFSQIPTTVDEVDPLTKRVKFADLEVLPLICVTEWSLPQPCKVLLQVEMPVNWQIATIMTCPSTWSKCVDSSPEQSLKEIKSEVSESWEQDKILRETTGNLLRNLECSSCESVGGESKQTEDNSKSKTQTCSLEYTNGDMNVQRPKPIQGGFSKCVIPCIYRFDGKNRVNQIESTPLPEISENQLSHLSLIHQENNVSMEDFLDEDKCSPHFISLPAVIIRKSKGESERKHKEAIEEGNEDGKLSQKNDIGKKGSFSHLQETADNDAFADSESSVLLSHQFQPEREDTKQKPKYKTITYADPSVKQTYKPKIIRFTDTFTF